MKAIQFKSFGPPDVLELVELSRPSCVEGSAIVQVHGSSVNPSDVKNVAGLFGKTTLPRVPGRDFSGVVVEGPSSWLGASVWGTGGDIGFTRDGSQAEFLRIPAASLARKPESLNHEEASAVGVNFVVAWLGTMNYARLLEGETIVVLGVGGGVGGAVAQIAKARGCRVIGVDRTPPPANSPASRLIDECLIVDESTADRVKDLTRGGADVVYDAVGGVVFEQALHMAKHRGRVVEISAVGKRRVEFDLIEFYRNETQLFGADSAKLDVVESARIMESLRDEFDKGSYQPPLIAQRFPLEEAKRAYQAVASGTQGRVVLSF
jgi:NADPH:quinone reductase-like Zn-dependent oxidoreductase